MSIPDVRARFDSGTKVLISVGGWGDVDGFDQATKTPEGMKTFAKGVARMVSEQGVDGVGELFYPTQTKHLPLSDVWGEC